MVQGRAVTSSSCTVVGNAMIEGPKSPLARLKRYLVYCSNQVPFRPNCSLYAAHYLGAAGDHLAVLCHLVDESGYGIAGDQSGE